MTNAVLIALNMVLSLCVIGLSLILRRSGAILSQTTKSARELGESQSGLIAAFERERVAKDGLIVELRAVIDQREFLIKHLMAAVPPDQQVRGEGRPPDWQGTWP